MGACDIECDINVIHCTSYVVKNRTCLLQDNLNLMFERSVATLKQDNPIRTVNAIHVSLNLHSAKAV